MLTELIQRHRPLDAKALSIVDTEVAQSFHGGFVFYKLGDGHFTQQLRDLIDTWKGRRLLDGSAGLPVGDLDALVELAVGVSQLAAASARILSLDLNPVVVHARGEGISVLDALIVTAGDQTGGTTPPVKQATGTTS